MCVFEDLPVLIALTGAEMVPHSRVVDNTLLTSRHVISAVGFQQERSTVS